MFPIPNNSAELDHRFVWHPFTQMRDWLRHKPVVIESGRGAVLRDIHGKEYLDANASIWTNLHGHNHPTLNAALITQLQRVAHTSALGLANPIAAQLAQSLIRAANPSSLRHHLNLPSTRCNPKLAKVFYSDDGSTAMEVALKLAYEYARRTGLTPHPRFLSLDHAYHGDTIGAVSLGHIQLFHKSYAGLLFKSDTVMSPYCYRCRFNRTRPERADARDYRRCSWQCVDQVETRLAKRRRAGAPYAAMIVEPLVQGAAGMIAHPVGWLQRITEIVRAHGTLLIADEVMTGFGRTGTPDPESGPGHTAGRTRLASKKVTDVLFASHHENVQPDLMALAKGLTGGYLPMAATLTSQAIFDAFLGEYAEFKTFFHGHSYTANPLGAAVALASLQLLQTQESQTSRRQLQASLRAELRSLWSHPSVGDIRQVGLVAGIELVRDWRTREPYPLEQQAGIRVCNVLRRHGVLTRPIGNVIVLMPPYCTSPAQVEVIVRTLHRALRATL